jgi:hypothetical protein
MRWAACKKELDSQGGWKCHTHTKLDRVSGVERFHGFLDKSWINREDFRNVRR